MSGKLARGALGTVHVRERANGRWQATALMRTLANEPRTLTATGDTEDLARAAIERLHQEAIGKRVSRMTETSVLGEAVETWLEYQISVEPQSHMRYRSDAASILAAFGAQTPLHELHGADIDAYLIGLVRDGLVSGAHRLRKRLRSVLMLAAQLGAPTSNAMEMFVKLPSLEKRESRLTPESWSMVLDSLEQWGGGEHQGRKSDWRGLRDVLTLCLTLRARVGEVLALFPEHIDLHEGTALISGTQVQVPGKGAFRQEHTKGRETRIIYLTKAAEAILARRVAAAGDGPLFQTAQGTMLAGDRVQKQMRAFRAATHPLWEKLGIPLDEVTTHLMRRSAATHVERSGGLELASSLLGHSSEQITRSAYVVTRRHVPRDAATILNEFEGR